MNWVDKIVKYEVELTFTSPILGSAPSSQEVYARYVASKMPDPTPEAIEKETATIPQDVEMAGKTIFRVDPETKALIYLPHQIRGFFKDAAAAVTGKELTAFRSKIDKFVFVSPDKIFLTRKGKHITEVDSALERPIKAMTAQGPRVSVISSEKLGEGVEISFTVSVLPLGVREITKDMLCAWLDYGKFQGISQWRNGGYGRFDYTIE